MPSAVFLRNLCRVLGWVPLLLAPVFGAGTLDLATATIPELQQAYADGLTAERVVRALRDKDLATLQSVPRVGRKKAEQLILDLADKLDDLQVSGSPPGPGGPRPEGAGAEDAIRALVSLGYSTGDAERAVRQAIDEAGTGSGAAELIRRALGNIRG